MTMWNASSSPTSCSTDGRSRSLMWKRAATPSSIRVRETPGTRCTSISMPVWSAAIAARFAFLDFLAGAVGGSGSARSFLASTMPGPNSPKGRHGFLRCLWTDRRFDFDSALVRYVATDASPIFPPLRNSSDRRLERCRGCPRVRSPSKVLSSIGPRRCRRPRCPRADATAPDR
jgi:hypothetical protein